MAIATTDILVTDLIIPSLEVINGNFQVVENQLNDLVNLLNTSTSVLTLKNGATTTITLTGATGNLAATSAALTGTLGVGGLTTLAALNTTGAATLGSTLAVTGNAQFSAAAILASTIRKPGGIAATDVDASSPAIVITDKYLLDLDYSALADGTTTLLTLPSGSDGQELLVRCSAISGATSTDGLAITNILNGGVTGLKFGAANANAKLYWDGTGWLILSLQNTTIL